MEQPKKFSFVWLILRFLGWGWVVFSTAATLAAVYLLWQKFIKFPKEINDRITNAETGEPK